MLDDGRLVYEAVVYVYRSEVYVHGCIETYLEGVKLLVGHYRRGHPAALAHAERKHAGLDALGLGGAVGVVDLYLDVVAQGKVKGRAVGVDEAKLAACREGNGRLGAAVLYAAIWFVGVGRHLCRTLISDGEHAYDAR